MSGEWTCETTGCQAHELRRELAETRSACERRAREDHEEIVALTANLADAYAEIDISHAEEQRLRTALQGRYGDVVALWAEARSECAAAVAEHSDMQRKLRELADELDAYAVKWQRAPGQRPGVRQSRFVAYTTAAAKLRRIVTESEGGDNQTAT